MRDEEGAIARAYVRARCWIDEAQLGRDGETVAGVEPTGEVDVEIRGEPQTTATSCNFAGVAS